MLAPVTCRGCSLKPVSSVDLLALEEARSGLCHLRPEWHKSSSPRAATVVFKPDFGWEAPVDSNGSCPSTKLYGPLHPCRCPHARVRVQPPVLSVLQLQSTGFEPRAQCTVVQ